MNLLRVVKTKQELGFQKVLFINFIFYINLNCSQAVIDFYDMRNKAHLKSQIFNN